MGDVTTPAFKMDAGVSCLVTEGGGGCVEVGEPLTGLATTGVVLSYKGKKYFCIYIF